MNIKKPAGISGLLGFLGEGPGRLGGSDVAAEQGGERLVQVADEAEAVSVVVVLDDADLLEECLVEHLLDVFGGFLVGPCDVDGQVECGCEVLLDDVAVTLQGFQLGLDAGHGLGDAFLLDAQEVDRHGSGVVGFEELEALTIQLAEFGLEGVLFLGDGHLGGLEALADHGLDAVPELGAKLDCLVEVGDLLLDLVDEGGLELALRSTRVASSAHEVGVAEP
ncbi:hypothetical protein [Microbacterium sp. NPDC076895]|uniref:hypothetical protein n=1 Tax=Microbacterium sp. NPDC076895 TaxID=3154957 RepID=UPI003422A784